MAKLPDPNDRVGKLSSLKDPDRKTSTIEPDSKSPLQEYVQEWKEKGQSTLRFFSQRSAILRDPRILQEAHPSTVAGWKTPLAFATFGLLLTSVAVSATGFVLKNFLNVEDSKHDWFVDSQKLTADLRTNEDLLERASHLTPGQTISLSRSGGVKEFGRGDAISTLSEENHKIRRVRALNGVFNWTIEYLQSVFLTLSIIIAAFFFKKSICATLSQSRFSNQADRFYLYSVTSRLFWASVIFNIAYVSGFLELGYVGAAMGIYLLYRASKDLYTAFDVPQPKSYWTAANKTFTALTSANLKSALVVALIEVGLGAFLYVIIVASA